MKLIVGLGNPGLSYKSTRHNVGALAVLKLALQRKMVFKNNRSFKSLIAIGSIDGVGVSLVLPETFMNFSGEAVAPFMKKKRVVLEDLLIVYDDVGLSLGELKVRVGGSDGGHHGLASVIESLGTRDLSRLRLGIGRPGLSGDISDFVLSRFDKEELASLDRMVELSIEAMKIWITQGVSACMNRFNKKAKRFLA